MLHRCIPHACSPDALPESPCCGVKRACYKEKRIARGTRHGRPWLGCSAYPIARPAP